MRLTPERLPARAVTENPVHPGDSPCIANSSVVLPVEVVVDEISVLCTGAGEVFPIQLPGVAIGLLLVVDFL